MPIDLVLAASFPAGPVLRPLRALADRLGMGVNLWSSPPGDVHDRQSTPDGARDWDVVLVRPADWSDHLEANVAELTGSLAGDTGTSPRRGTVVCICPSGQADDLDAERLADRLRRLPSTTVLTPTEIIRPYAVRKIVADLEWLDGPAYTHEFYAGLAAAVMRVLDRRHRPPVKLVAVDADHTLWDGACGEDPPERLRMGPGRRAFHRRLAELRASGVLLCLLTRNHQPDVDRVFAHRPDLPVTLDDFTVVDASWSPKPAMLRAACGRLGIDPGSAVFVDDNPGECAEMAAAAPTVRTLRFPAEDADVPAFLAHAWPLDTPDTTAEDLRRAELYRHEEARHRFLTGASSRTRLADLGLRVTVRPAVAADAARIVQLSERTTQFTTSTDYLTSAAAADLAGGAGPRCLVVEVADRFGNYGLTGIVVQSVAAATMTVHRWMLSCRVLGRGVEHEVLRRLAVEAAALGAHRLVMPVTPTERNRPLRDFLAQVGARPVALPDGCTAVLIEVDLATAAVEGAGDGASGAESGDRRTAPGSSEGRARGGAAGRPAPPVDPVAARGLHFLAQLAEPSIDARTLHRLLAGPAAGGDRPAPAGRLGLWRAAVLAAWEAALGVEGLRDDDDVFDAWGATSVDVLAACTTLRRSLGVSLPPAQVLTLGTPAAQADALMADAPARVPIVARVRAGGGAPLVFFAPAGGLAYAYLELVRRLDGDQPVFVAQAPELADPDSELLDLPALIARYVAELRAALPADAVAFAGWSFGALLAYETAAHLAHTGGGGPDLLLFDPPSAGVAAAGPSRDTGPLPRFFDLLDPTAVTAQSLAAIHRTVFPEDPPACVQDGLDAVWARLLARLLDGTEPNRRRRLLLPELEPLGVLRGAQVWKKNQRLAAAYRPTAGFPGRAHVFVVEGTAEHLLEGPLRGRAATHAYPIRAAGGLHAHSAMMEPGNVALFADDVNQALRPRGARRRPREAAPVCSVLEGGVE